MAIHLNITREEYNKLEGINASKLKGYYESALNGNYERSKPYKESDAMFFGTACHSMILEPHLFKDIYEVMPTCPEELWIKQTGKDKGQRYKKKPNAVKEWEDSLPTDKLYLSKEQDKILTRIKSNLGSNETAQKILNACPKRETAITWIDERTGLKCKALMDFIGDNILGDFKTTREIPKRFNLDGTLDEESTARAIRWDLIKTRNILQFSFYLDGCIANGLDVEKFAVIFAQNNGGCDTHSIFLSEESIDIGRNMYNRSLDNWIERDKNKGCFDGIMEV